ncbi:MAG: glycosyltransferase family 4 protein, partial [Candidatus Hodarchaeota archaeon]
ASKNIEIVYPGGYPISRIPKKRGNYVLAVGRWGLNKKPDMFIDIWKRLDTKMKLVVAGFWAKESVRELFAKRVKMEELEKWVDIRGPADKEQLIKLYTGARVLIHPLFEAFGMIALEAAGCGCPFIIPRGSGVTDLFRHGVHGFFPKEGDVEAYTNYLNQLIFDEHLAWKMGSDAWKMAQRYDYEEHTKQLENVILRHYQ